MAGFHFQEEAELAASPPLALGESKEERLEDQTSPDAGPAEPRLPLVASLDWRGCRQTGRRQRPGARVAEGPARDRVTEPTAVVVPVQSVGIEATAVAAVEESVVGRIEAASKAVPALERTEYWVGTAGAECTRHKAVVVVEDMARMAREIAGAVRLRDSTWRRTSEAASACTHTEVRPVRMLDCSPWEVAGSAWDIDKGAAPLMGPGRDSICSFKVVEYLSNKGGCV